MAGKRLQSQRMQEDRYRTIVENQSDMVCWFRLDGTLLFVNNSFARARSESSDNLMGANLWSQFDSESSQAAQRRLLQLKPQQSECSFELKRRDRDDWELWLVRALRFNEQAQPEEFQGCAVDISEHKRSEINLRQGESRMLRALRGAQAAAWTLDVQTGEIICTEELPIMYGYPASRQFRFDLFLARIHPEDRAPLMNTFRQQLKSKQREFQLEFRALHPQHGLRWILDSGEIERDENGRALRFHGINMDVTERKQNEEALRASELNFRRLAEAVPTLVWASRADGSITYVNPRWTEYSGQSQEEASGFGWLDLIHPDDVKPTYRFWKHCIETGEVYEGEIRYRSRRGEYRWHHYKAVRTYGEDGQISGWYGAALDVHEQKRVEQALRSSEGLFRTIADSAPAILWTSEPSGSCTFISNSWTELTGQAKEDALGRGWISAMHPEDRERIAEIFRRANARQEAFSFDCRIATRDGDYRWAVDTARPRFSGNAEFLGYIGSVVDVDERKRAEQTLRESEERFRTLADNMSQLAWMADPSGSLFWFNRRWYEFTGTSEDDMRGWGWTKILRAEDRQRVVDHFQNSWETGEEWEDTFQLRGHDGSYRWFLSRALPIRGDDGRIIRWFGTNTDVTAQRDAEQALKQADQRKNEFLATLAHELRNPLAPLRNGLEIMRLANDDPAVVQTARSMMERQLEHMVHLVDDLLDLSRISRGKITLHNKRMPLNAAIQQAVETVRPSIESFGQQLTLRLPPEPVFVEGDLTRLAQVFANLLNNASKFTGQGGSIWLTVEVRDGEAVASILDDGVGIAKHLLPHIFDMFTQGDPTLERSHGGLGIGLALVRGLVELHGGKVEAHSDGLGLGSEFRVCLPVVKAPVTNNRAAHDKAPFQSKRRRILVVDDNRDSAISMAKMLELTGNETQTAHDGLEALGVAATFRPDTILLDIGMPKLNGYDVAKKIRSEDWGRETTLVALTGWGQEEDRRRSQEAGFDYHLVKPVELSSVEEILSKTSPLH